MLPESIANSVKSSFIFPVCPNRSTPRGITLWPSTEPNQDNVNWWPSITVKIFVSLGTSFNKFSTWDSVLFWFGDKCLSFQLLNNISELVIARTPISLNFSPKLAVASITSAAITPW